MNTKSTKTQKSMNTQSKSTPSAPKSDESAGQRIATKAALAEADIRQDQAAADRGPEPHPDAPVPFSGGQRGEQKSPASSDVATHTDEQKRGEKRSGV